MSKDLAATTLQELLPPVIAGDPGLSPAASALQPEIAALADAIPGLELYSRIDELPEPILRLLAWENRVDGAEWSLALTLEDKRNLVKNSFDLNKRRGTRWSIERVFELLRLRAEIVEWWEEGADPFTFRIAVLDVGNRGIKTAELTLIDQLIDTYKPLTRHITGINLEVAAPAEFWTAAGPTLIGELDVFPHMPGEIEFDVTFAVGIAPQTTRTITIGE